MATVSGKIKSFDGTELFFTKDLVDGAKAVVLIVHGLAEHLGRYDWVTGKLNEAGFNVYRFDHRGHGKTEGPRGFVKDFHEFVDDASFMVDVIKRENPDLPVFVLGHSMGGLVVSCFGAKYPGKAQGIIISGGITHTSEALEGTRALDPMMMLPNSLSALVSSDPEVVKAYEADPLILKETTAGLFAQMYEGVEWFKANEKNFTDPCLILHGGADQIVAPVNSELLYQNISSTDKELKIYDGLYHEIMNEPDKEKVLQDICSWIASRVS